MRIVNNEPDPCPKLYYMAPIGNAVSITLTGIYSYNLVKENPTLAKLAVSIADPFVNDRRHSRQIGERTLHDFVPLYWATHTPMQYVVTQKERRLRQEALVFFVFDAAQILSLPDIWTTDGNAASSASQILPGAGAVRLLEWRILREPSCYSPEYKRKKCAEVLVPDQVDEKLIERICVQSEEVRAILQDAVKDAAAAGGQKSRLPPIGVAAGFYYPEPL